MSNQSFRARVEEYMAAANAAADLNERRRLFNLAIYWHSLAIQTEALMFGQGAGWARGGQRDVASDRRKQHQHA